jgi:hypothetical protein
MTSGIQRTPFITIENKSASKGAYREANDVSLTDYFSQDNTQMKKPFSFKQDTNHADHSSHIDNIFGKGYKGKPDWNQSKDENENGFTFSKYDFQVESMNDTATTMTATSQSTLSYTPSKEPPRHNSQRSPYKTRAPVNNNYDDLDMSSSFDSHFDFLATRETKSMQLKKDALKNDKESNSGYDLPRIPRHPSPFHSRLSESNTKSSSLRLLNKASKYTESVNRPPFYTTISKANSFSDSTVSSMSMLTIEKAEPKQKKPSSFHNRLANTETFSSSLHRQHRMNRRTEVVKQTDKKNRRPFYTTVVDSSKNRSKRSNTPLRSRYAPSRSEVVPKISVYGEQRRRNLAKVSNEEPKQAVSRSRVSVYDRLSKTGTASSLQKNRNSLYYKKEEKTVHESCQTALMRDFKGSTFVPVSTGRVTKSVIGSVVDCGY